MEQQQEPVKQKLHFLSISRFYHFMSKNVQSYFPAASIAEIFFPTLEKYIISHLLISPFQVLKAFWYSWPQVWDQTERDWKMVGMSCPGLVSDANGSEGKSSLLMIVRRVSWYSPINRLNSLGTLFLPACDKWKIYFKRMKIFLICFSSQCHLSFFQWRRYHPRRWVFWLGLCE